MEANFVHFRTQAIGFAEQPIERPETGPAAF